ncbi:transmembrane protein 272 isoform 2-T2 [Liasis olivaceus]
MVVDLWLRMWQRGAGGPETGILPNVGARQRFQNSPTDHSVSQHTWPTGPKRGFPILQFRYCAWILFASNFGRIHVPKAGHLLHPRLTGLFCGSGSKKKRVVALLSPWLSPPPHSGSPQGRRLAAMAEESQPETLLLRATEEPSSVHSVLMVLGKLLFAVLAVAGIVIGIVYFGQCPQQPPLPVYVVILGIVTLLLLFLSCIPCGDGTNRPSTLLSCFRAAGFLLLCAWFIAGNVWVYSIYPPDYEAVGQPNFCQRTLFLFAFGVTTAIHVALAVALLLALGILAVILILNALMSYGRHSCPRGP